MVDGDDAQPAPPAILAASWQTAMFLGAATLILGLIVTLHPTGSVNVIAVLLGILMILSGIFHLIRVFDTAEPHRVVLAVAVIPMVAARRRTGSVRGMSTTRQQLRPMKPIPGGLGCRCVVRGVSPAGQ